MPVSGQLPGTPNHTLGLTEKPRSVPSGAQCDPVDGLQAGDPGVSSSIFPFFTCELIYPPYVHVSALHREADSFKGNSPNPGRAVLFCLQSSTISNASGLLRNGLLSSSEAESVSCQDNWDLHAHWCLRARWRNRQTGFPWG